MVYIGVKIPFLLSAPYPLSSGPLSHLRWSTKVGERKRGALISYKGRVYFSVHVDQGSLVKTDFGQDPSGPL
jgi:hypothetical protein